MNPVFRPTTLFSLFVILSLHNAASIPASAQTAPPASSAISPPSAPKLTPTVMSQGTAPARQAVQAQVTPAAVLDSTGELQLSVVIVDELTPKPVPLTYFTVTNDANATSTQAVKTDEQGKIDLHLAPGTYMVQIQKPIDYKNHSYAWKGSVTITAGQVSKLDWTDADATAQIAKPARQMSDEAVIYTQRKSAVVTVEGDEGSGSGFVVDPAGLILTNAHVVAGGRWAAVRFDRGIRVPAVIVERDTAADVAVLRINPSTYPNFTVMPLADPSAGPLATEGEKVLAIGSPLHQEKILTIGIVSKFEGDHLISDVNINHGNSGGPLINLAGDAVGITTFMDLPDQGGPGISGIIAITKALPVLERARKKMASLPLPSGERLPDISPTPIPEDALSLYAVRDVQPYSEGKPKNFETVITTPFFIAAQQAAYVAAVTNAERDRRLRKRGPNSDTDDLHPGPSPFYMHYLLDQTDPVVWVKVRPVLKEKSSSVWAGVFGALGGVHVQAHGEFRDDFYDMALYRGDTLVHPVRRYREKVSVLYDNYTVQANDNAYGGIYFYDPSAFAPGAKLVLYVRRESDLTRWDTVSIKESEQKNIYARFAPYRNALAQAQGTAASTSIMGLSSVVHTPPVGSADWDPDTGYVQPEAVLAASMPAPPAARVPSTRLASTTAAPSPSPVSVQPAAAIASVPTPPVALPVPTLPPAPRLPEIKSFPQKVRMELNDGNSFFGSVTAFDGTAYVLQTAHTGIVNVQQSTVKSLELLPNDPSPAPTSQPTVAPSAIVDSPQAANPPPAH